VKRNHCLAMPVAWTKSWWSVVARLERLATSRARTGRKCSAGPGSDARVAV
jgi:hypothetical protein